MSLGPDAARYLHRAIGGSVPRPFNMRWLLPAVCGRHLRRWWVVYVLSWPLLAVSAFAWQADKGWQVAAATAVLLVALPGILGPSVVAPVGVDLPSSALALAGVALWPHCWPLALACVCLATFAKETAPVFVALWLWNPLPLLLLTLPFAAHQLIPPGPDPLGPKFQLIADHPIKASLQHHAGRWRDGWLMVAPWGVCLAALYAPDWRLLLVLAVAYGQLLIATDSVRLYQHAAGPVMAAMAAQVIPVQFLPLALVAHVVWWRTPERI